MQIKKEQLELDKEQQTGSKSGKEYVKAVYCHCAYLTYMQSPSCEMQAGWEAGMDEALSEALGASSILFIHLVIVT